MLLQRSLIIIAICLGGIGLSHSQSAPSPASSDPQELSEADPKSLDEEQQKKIQQQAQELKKEALEKAEAQNKEQVSKTKPPKEVFKPTEEISEDSPVPFPVDI